MVAHHQPLEMAVRGTHNRIVSVVEQYSPDRRSRLLDIGAGQGALAARLKEAGYRVDACDRDTSAFVVPGVACRKVDAGAGLPYGNEEFDVVLAIELVEHLDGHGALLLDAARVLKPGGYLILSTPNVVSLKSRLRFMFSGYCYSFGPLDTAVCDPSSQHISALTLDQYLWRIAQTGLERVSVLTDQYQYSSLALSFLIPFIALYTRWRWPAGAAGLQNSPTALFGRKLVIVARKPN
jgi:SAM-dependent methyltransferase